MMTQKCAVCACTDAPGDQLIVALWNTVGFAAVCQAHGEAIRSGQLQARAFAAGRRSVGLQPLPAG